MEHRWFRLVWVITEARNLNANGKLIIPIIDVAHLLPPVALNKLRLL